MKQKVGLSIGVAAGLSLSAMVAAAYGPYADELPCESSEAKSFCAATGYVTHDTADSAKSSIYIYSFNTNDIGNVIGDNCGKWSEDAWCPHAGAKYYAKNTLITPNNQGNTENTVYAFAGDELVIGNGGSLQSMSAGKNYPAVDNLFMLGGSQFYWSNSKNALAGNAHIRRSEGAPVKFSANIHIIQSFDMDVDGGADEQIEFTCSKKEKGTINYKLGGDWSRYSGAVTVRHQYAADYGAATVLAVKGRDFPAAVTVTANCAFKTSAAGDLNLRALTVRTQKPFDIAANVTWSVGDLVIDEEATFTFGKTASALVVNGSLAIPSGSLTLKAGGIDATVSPDAQVSELIKFGPDVDTAAIPLDKIRIVPAKTSGEWPTVSFTIEDDAGTGGKKLVARRNPIIKRESSFETTKMDCHFWRAQLNASNEYCWTDHEAPHAGADYVLSKDAIPPETGSDEVPFVFGGDSLTISSGNYIFSSGHLQYWDLKDLRITGNVMFRTYNNNLRKTKIGDASLSTWELRGKVMIAGGVAWNLSPYISSCLQLVADEICGAGDLKLSSYRGAKQKGTNSGRIKLDGLNTNFTGRVYFDQAYYEKKSGETIEYVIPDLDTHVWLYVTDGRNLGGPLTNFSHRALTVNDYGRLVALNDVTLDQANRGVLVNWVGQFDVPNAGDTLTIKNPLTLNGTLRKCGAGELVLGGRLRFATNDDESEVGAPNAEGCSNVVTVAEGSLRVAAKDALNGAAVTFMRGTALTVDPFAEGEVKTCGLCNVLEGGSLAAEDGKIPVAFKLPADFEKGPALMAAICTVKKDTLTVDSFAFAKTKGYKVRIVKATDETAGTDTFTAVAEPSGIFVIVK